MKNIIYSQNWFKNLRNSKKKKLLLIASKSCFQASAAKVLRTHAQLQNSTHTEEYSKTFENSSTQLQKYFKHLKRFEKTKQDTAILQLENLPLPKQVRKKLGNFVQRIVVVVVIVCETRAHQSWKVQFKCVLSETFAPNHGRFFFI